MRVQLWLSSIASLLLVSVAATNAHAQFGGTPHPQASNPDYGSGSFYQTSHMAGMSQYGLQPMQQFGPPPMGGYGGGYGAGGYDTGVLPDQNIFEKVLGASVTVPFKMNFSYIRTRTKSPDSVVIGDERVSTRSILRSLDAGDDEEGEADDAGEVFDPVSGLTVQENYLDGTDPWGPIAVDEIYDEGPEGGIRVGFNLGNLDQAGLQVTGFWNQQYKTGRRFGELSALNYNFDTDPITRISPTGIGEPNEEEIDHILDAYYPGTPYFNGVPLENDSDGSLGDVAYFDVFAEYKYDTQTFGASATQSFSAVYRKKSIQIQPVVGVSYIGIREGFSMFGRHSGLTYVVTLPDGTFSPDGGDDGDDDGDDDAEEEEESTWIQINPMLDTVVNSTVRSNLIGPDAGFRLVVGGDNLRLASQTKVGLLVNQEKIHLKGSGVQNNLQFSGGPLSFDQTKTTTHLSPMLEQSLNVQTNLFRNFPVIRNIDLFDEAVVSVGHTSTFIWEVARPGSVIQWNGAPLVPEIDVNRESFWTTSWDFGVHWNY